MIIDGALREPGECFLLIGTGSVICYRLSLFSASVVTWELGHEAHCKNRNIILTNVTRQAVLSSHICLQDFLCQG